MAEQFQRSVQTSGDGIPQLDTQEYYTAMQQVMQNPQFMSMAEKLGSALMRVGKLLMCLRWSLQFIVICTNSMFSLDATGKLIYSSGSFYVWHDRKSNKSFSERAIRI